MNAKNLAVLRSTGLSALIAATACSGLAYGGSAAAPAVKTTSVINPALFSTVFPQGLFPAGTDPSTPSQTTVALPCSKTRSNGVTKEGSGLSTCDDLVERASRQVSERIGDVVAHFYEHKHLWFRDMTDSAPAATDGSQQPPKKSPYFCVKDRDIPVKVCSERTPGTLETSDCSDGKGPTNYKDYAKYDSNGMDFSTCGNECSWFNGLRVQVWGSKREEVLQELKGGQLRLVSFPNDQDSSKPILPCGTYADRINSLKYGDAQAGAEGLLDAINKLGANTGLEFSCSEHGSSVSVASLYDVLPARHLAALGFDPKSKPAAGPNGPKVAYVPEQSACQLRMARAMVEQLLVDLATCEVMYRAFPKNYFLSRFANIADPTGAFNTTVVQPCAQVASDKQETDPNKAWDDFYQCYSKGDHSVQKFFETAYSDPSIATTETIPSTKRTPDDQLEECPNLTTFSHVLAVVNSGSGFRTLASSPGNVGAVRVQPVTTGK